MIRPILAFGNSLLRKACEPVDQQYQDLNNLIDDMWETMENAQGCGLAAPQVGVAIRLFVVDSKTTFNNLSAEERRISFDKKDTGIKQVFINARIIGRSENCWNDEEGCLSIPGFSRTVERPWAVTVEYHDEYFRFHKNTFFGATARMIQHEFDHTEGILYLDYLKPITRKLIAPRLKKISKGDVDTGYPMRFV